MRQVVALSGYLHALTIGCSPLGISGATPTRLQGRPPSRKGKPVARRGRKVTGQEVPDGRATVEGVSGDACEVGGLPARRPRCPRNARAPSPVSRSAFS